MSATLHTTGVISFVAGSTRIEAALLQKKLGRAAFLVWQLFLSRRDFYGYSALTRRKIKTLIQFPCGNQKKALERALRRLAISGLVVAEKYKRPHTWKLKNGMTRTRALMVRQVHGDCDSGGEFIVPIAVSANILVMVTKGGARKGAGRPKKGIQKGPNVEFKEGTHSASIASSCKGSSLPSEEKNTGVPPVALPVGGEPFGKGLPFRIGRERAPELEVPRTFLEFDGLSLLHDYPSYDLLNPAVVPSPPKLNPDDPDGSWALSLIRAYRGALQSRFKLTSTAFRKGSVTSSKYLKPLVEAAKMLQQHDIAPASWAAFSCDVWKKYGKGPKPSLQWVFAAKRIEANHDWFKSELSSYTGRRVVFGDAAREVMNRYQRLQMRLRGATTEKEALAMVEQELPADSYKRLIEAARKEADAERTRLRVAVGRGEWLWR